MYMAKLLKRGHLENILIKVSLDFFWEISTLDLKPKIKM